jgi:hypothetical protein
MPFDKSGVWRPDGLKQESFLALPETIKEAIIGGGVQTGKTELLLLYGVIRRWHLNGQFKQVYMRRQLNQIRNEVVPRSKQIFGRMAGWKYNASYMYWTYESGAMIFLAGCELEDDVHNWDTTEISLFTPDELTSFTEWMYLYIGFERVRSPKGSGLPALIRGAAMPGDIGHTWVRKRFVDPAPEGGKVIIGRGGVKRFYVHATLADSERIDKDYENQLDALPEAERQAKKFGNWNSYQGQVFDEFRERHYAGEPEHALHIIERDKQFEIPKWWPRIFIIDWGYAAFNYVGYGAISPQSRVYFYRERWWLKTKIEEWSPFVKEDIERENPRVIKICQSAKQDRGQEHTIHQQVQSALGTTVQLTSNRPGSRIAGKALIHEYLRWKEKHIPHQEIPQYDEELASFLYRNRSIEEYDSYLRSLVPPEPETNLPKLLIFAECVKLRDSLKACVYDKNNPEDVAEFFGDDPYDVLRYMLDAVDRYFDESKSEWEKIQKQAALEAEFARTQNWTMLYHKARILEQNSTIAGLPKPIARYHRTH